MLNLVQEFVRKIAAGPKDFIGEVEGNPTVVEVQLGIRTIEWLKLGLHHWSVLLKLSNGQSVCVQFHTTGAVTADVFKSDKDAALHTCPRRAKKVRIANYGSTRRPVCWSDVRAWIETQQGGRYIFGFRDCQNFARTMIRWLTGTWVGVWPKGSGVAFAASSTVAGTKLCVTATE